MAIGQELLNVPMGDMIRQMALSIADAQKELDESSVEVAELMSGRRVLRDANGAIVMVPKPNPAYVSGSTDTTKLQYVIAVPTTGVTSTSDANLALKVAQYEDTTVLFGGEQVSMMELGFTPTFYQFIDTIIEVKIAIKITREVESTVTTKGRKANFGFQKGKGLAVNTSQVDATYSAKYGYTAEGSSLLRTKLVPIPPPAILEERIRKLLATEGTPKT